MTGSRPHNSCLLGLMVFMTVSLVVVLVITALNNIPSLAEAVYGNRDVAQTDNLEETLIQLEMSPAGWAFSIWGLIYIWQLVGVCYILSTAVRAPPTDPQQRLYLAPRVFCPTFYVSHGVGNLLGATWLILAALENAIGRFCVIVPMWIVSLIPLAVSLPSLKRQEANMSNGEVWMVRLMVHNGLGTYAGWMTGAWVLGLGSLLLNTAGLAHYTTSMVCLAIIGLQLLVWTVLDLAVLYRFTNYLFMPYVVVVWTLTGSILEQLSLQYTTTPLSDPAVLIFTAVLLAVAIVIAIVKVVLLVVRHKHSDALRTDSKVAVDDSGANPTVTPTEKAVVV